MEELKRCPFCGGEAEIITKSGEKVRTVIIKCTHCPTVRTSKFLRMNMNDAVILSEKAWNRRADGWISTADEKPIEQDAVKDCVLTIDIWGEIHKIHWNTVRHSETVTKWIRLPKE